MAQLTCPLAYQAQLRPEAIVLVERQADGKRRLVSYQQLQVEVDRYCAWLQRQQLAPGQRLAVLTDDKGQLVRWLLACLRQAVVLIPINPDFCGSQRTSLIEQCQPQLVIDNPVQLGTDTGHSPQPLAMIDEDLALTGLFTSGSGGRPKLVVHNYRQHLASAQASQSLIPLTHGDGWGLSLPLFHISGLAIVIRCLNAGAQLLIPAPSEKLDQLLSDPALTHLSAVPTQLIKLQQQGLGFQHCKLKHLLLGGSSMPTPLLEWLVQQPFHSWISYGMTELASQIATGPVNDQGVLEKLLPHCRLSLDPQHQLLINGDSLMMGYFDNGRLHRPVDDNGWFATGDLGSWDPQQGLTIWGRKGLGFISGGENIQPEQLERLICQHPQIEHCIVVPVEDPLYGQRPVALVASTEPVEECALADWASEQLAPYQRPKAWFELPDRGSTLKPDRRSLRHWARQQLAID